MVTIASNNGHEVISGMKRVNIDSILNVLTSLVKKGGGKLLAGVYALLR
ncbi:holin [Escherichia coli]|nr:holin [Escherichia coli]EIF6901738.1 holin [Escherichia coli]